jgi:5-methylthioadenosine/S-adenosylhomocysteine deaminase
VLPTAEARLRYTAAETVSLPEHILTPGLINLHCHAAMTLMRGLADDLPLMRWLQEAIWPTEARHASTAFVRDGSLLAAAEMLRGGITTCNDMYFFPEATAEAFDRLGLRAVLGITVIEFPSQYASDADDYLHKGLATFDAWRDHPLIRFALAPHAPYTVADATLRTHRLAGRRARTPHPHPHPRNRQEIEDSLRTSASGRSPGSRPSGSSAPT